MKKMLRSPTYTPCQKGQENHLQMKVHNFPPRITHMKPRIAPSCATGCIQQLHLITSTSACAGPGVVQLKEKNDSYHLMVSQHGKFTSIMVTESCNARGNILHEGVWGGGFLVINIFLAQQPSSKRSPAHFETSFLLE